jgi:hypothetical protein
MKKIILSILLCLGVGLMPFAAMAGVPSDHGCFSDDGNIWCDLCDEPMKHDCFSLDGNSRCDLCDELIIHTCHDQDGNGSCDVCTRPCENTGYLPGDVTGEGTVNMADVAKLYAHIKGTSPLTAGLDRCDITGEGTVNMADVAKLCAHIKGTKKLF